MTDQPFPPNGETPSRGIQPHEATYQPDKQPDGGFPEPPKPPQKRGIGRRWAVIGAAVAFVAGCTIGGLAAGGADPAAKSINSAAPVATTAAPTKAATAAPTPSPTRAPARAVAPVKPAGPPATVEGDGTYKVGDDMAAGEYVSKGNDDGCYWARLRDASGDFDAIIANDTGAGTLRAQVKKGEYFDTSNCNKWTRE